MSLDNVGCLRGLTTYGEKPSRSARFAAREGFKYRDLQVPRPSRRRRWQRYLTIRTFVGALGLTPWLTVTAFPATVSVALRVVVPVFAATL